MEASGFIDKLKNSCSEITLDWQEHLEFWEGEERGEYNDISVIVHYVIDRYKQNETGDFCEIFSILEDGLTSGNSNTEELALIGFIEDLLFVGSHSNILTEHFKPWIGNESFSGMLKLETAFKELPISHSK